MKARKKVKFKKLYWPLASLAAVAVFFVLLLHRPSRYKAFDITAAGGHNQGQVSTYLTHELYQDIYNGVQRRKPFDIIITQEGINDVVAWLRLPQNNAVIRFSSPEVLFAAEGIVLMATASFRDMEFVVTVVVEAWLDKAGLLNLHVAKVKIGAVNITPLARLIARRMYLGQPGGADIRAKIAGALLNSEPFDPAFKIDDKKIQLEKIVVEQRRLTIRLAPAAD